MSNMNQDPWGMPQPPSDPWGNTYMVDQQPAPWSAPPPSVVPTVLITFFFGLFGLIPAIRHSQRAQLLGQPSGRYWGGFAGALVGAALAQVGAVLAVIFLLIPALLPTTTAATTAPSNPAPTLPPVSSQPMAPYSPAAAPTTTTPPTTKPPVTFPANATPCPATTGQVGGFSASAAGTDVTSCPFAEAVRVAYGGQSVRGQTVNIQAYSPVTGRNYTMTCSGSDLVTCTGGNNAVVHLIG